MLVNSSSLPSAAGAGLAIAASKSPETSRMGRRTGTDHDDILLLMSAELKLFPTVKSSARCMS